MKRLGLLAIVAAAAILLVLQLQNRKQHGELLKTEQLSLFHLEQNEVQQVVVYRHRANHPVVRFAKRGDDWWLLEPEEYPASNYNVEAIVREATGLQSSRSMIPQDIGKSFAAFGVTDPRFRVTLSGAGKTGVLAIGDKMPIGSKVYARTGTDPEIHLIGDSLEAYLDKKIEDWRRKDLFWNFPTQISTVELAFASQITRMVASPGTAGVTWKLASGGDLADNKVEDLIRSVKNLTATNFSDDKLQGIDRAVKLDTNKGEIVVLMEKMDDNTYLAEIPGRPFRYKLGKYGANRIFPDMQELLPPPPVPVSAAVEVTSP